ncbi:MAG: caleosin family protein [Vicinamibacterales bacterium]
MTDLNPAARAPKPIRLAHSAVGRCFIVHDGRVYAEITGEGRIRQSDRYTGPAESPLLAAAQYFTDYYEAPFPGAKSRDPDISSGGRLNDKETVKFAEDPDGVPARRPDLFGHLDFFDRRNGDGMITLRENYLGWRDLGFGLLRSAVLTLGSALVFGRAADRFGIDVERIGEKRPKGATGIYDANGNVDRMRLAAFAAAFDESPIGVLTHQQLEAALAARATLGRIPRRQFRSLLALTARINRSNTVTRDQFLGLFDNSLFWLAASLPDRSGRRRL